MAADENGLELTADTKAVQGLGRQRSWRQSVGAKTKAWRKSKSAARLEKADKLAEPADVRAIKNARPISYAKLYRYVEPLADRSCFKLQS